MDPNETLRVLRELLREDPTNDTDVEVLDAIVESVRTNTDDPTGVAQDVENLAEDLRKTWERLDQIVERFEALDQWLCNGGFLPQVWDPALMQNRKG